MAATRIYSTAAYFVAAGVAIVFGFSPKFGAVIAATPGGVLGGITVVLYGMIGLLGAKIWKENRVDFGNPINLVPVAAGIIIAIGNTTLDVHRQLRAQRDRARHARDDRRLPPGPRDRAATSAGAGGVGGSRQDAAGRGSRGAGSARLRRHIGGSLP